MKAAFMWTPETHRETGDATATHKALPRAKRKALRYTPTKQRTNYNTKTSLSADAIVDTWLSIHDPMNDREYLALNTCDPDACGACLNEFQDDYGVDDPATHYTQNGLTIVAMGKDTRRWLKGYNIL